MLNSLRYSKLVLVVSELFVEVLRSVSECPNPTVNFTSLPSLLNENIFFPVYEAGFLKFICILSLYTLTPPIALLSDVPLKSREPIP